MDKVLDSEELFMQEIIPPIERELIKKELTDELFLRYTNNGNNEVYLNEWLSCTIGKEDYNNGYGSFKKIY